MKKLALALIATAMLSLTATATAETLVYFGTDTGGSSQGIYVSTFDETTGTLSPPKLAAAIGKAGFVTAAPGKPWVYSVAATRAADGAWQEKVAAFAVQADASLALLNTQSSQGSGPCHVSVDASGRVLLVANYNGGTIASYPIRDDGSLGPAASTIRHEGASVNTQRQASPHPHGIYPGPTQTYVYVPDLGLDKVVIYRLDAAGGRLLPNTPAHASTEPGGGPRHLAFHPNGRYAYVNLELSSRVTAYRVDAASGALESFQVLSSLPADASAEGNSTAEVVVHPDGRFLYVSNRGHDSIAVFAIDPQDGSLRFIEATRTGGRTPRNFALAPGGRFLVAANQNSGNVTVLRIDPERGTLSSTGSEVAVDRPTYVRFMRR